MITLNDTHFSVELSLEYTPMVMGFLGDLAKIEGFLLPDGTMPAEVVPLKYWSDRFGQRRTLSSGCAVRFKRHVDFEIDEQGAEEFFVLKLPKRNGHAVHISRNEDPSVWFIHITRGLGYYHGHDDLWHYLHGFIGRFELMAVPS